MAIQGGALDQEVSQKKPNNSEALKDTKIKQTWGPKNFLKITNGTFAGTLRLFPPPKGETKPIF